LYGAKNSSKGLNPHAMPITPETMANTSVPCIAKFEALNGAVHLAEVKANRTVLFTTRKQKETTWCERRGEYGLEKGILAHPLLFYLSVEEE
jgi:hypothetical protein